MEEQDVQQTKRGRLRVLRRAAAVLLVLLALALLVVWLLRERMASGYIESELSRRGVQASYEIEQIGFGTQILENVVIGDPRRPDATVERLEIGILVGFDGPYPGLIRARGVRLRGRVVDGRLSLGEIDKLLPPPSGAPFVLPDQRVDVDNAAIVLDTPAGRLALGLTGRGNLSDGFQGRMSLVARQLELGGCTLEGPRANVAVRVDDLRPSVDGPVALRRLDCAGAASVDRALIALNASLAPALDSWRGRAALRTDAVQSGANGVAGLEGRITFAGNAASTRGTARLEARELRSDAGRASRTAFAGDYQASLDQGRLALAGDVEASGLTVSEGHLRSAARALRAAAGTPLGPISASLADALLRAGLGGSDVRGRLRVALGDGAGNVTVERLRLESRSGARLLADGGDGISYSWPGGLRLDGDIALAGGGFPDARFILRQATRGGPLQGSGRIAPVRVGNTRLALGEIRFAAAPGGGTTFRTIANLDGPFSGGRVEGLVMPLSGRFAASGFTLNEGCVAASFRALQVQSLRLGPTRLPLCPTGRALLWQENDRLRGGAELRAPRFAGRLGESPIGLAASRLRVGLEGFAASDLAVRLGPADAVNRIDIGNLSGRFGGGGVAGSYAGLSGDLAAVPLLVREGAGDWRFAGGALAMEGRVEVADKMQPARFMPLTASDFRLTLADNLIRAGGTLAHPASGARVAVADIRHDLGTGAGHATLDVPGLTFATGGLQPDTLTPLTLGVVSLVNGTVTGQGRIDWDGQGVRSTGSFATEGMNLAAPFGPVENLTTRIEFTDLLGLVSAPAQEARVGRIQAGVDVYDGVVRYQLRPNYNVAVEDARWPFAGGTLALQPTVLDFSRETTKYLTFRVEALDAARFIELMEFSNIAATGTFDGVLPMRFDETGAGHIIDGRMTAREGGGTLSYVGELSDRDLGAYGILAFNALKSLRYSRFDLTLDGALDGEFITRIQLDGIARDPALTTLPSGGGITEMVAGRVFGQLARIPFEFNIRIQGQFRSLIATARSFNDPTPLIQSVIADAIRDEAATQTDVQDEESEPVQ